MYNIQKTNVSRTVKLGEFSIIWKIIKVIYKKYKFQVRLANVVNAYIKFWVQMWFYFVMWFHQHTRVDLCGIRRFNSQKQVISQNQQSNVPPNVLCNLSLLPNVHLVDLVHLWILTVLCFTSQCALEVLGGSS